MSAIEPPNRPGKAPHAYQKPWPVWPQQLRHAKANLGSGIGIVKKGQIRLTWRNVRIVIRSGSSALYGRAKSPVRHGGSFAFR
jgi:hypothetical protein